MKCSLYCDSEGHSGVALLEESIGVEFEVPVYGGRCDPSRAGALLSPAPFPAAMATGSSLWDGQPQIDIFSCKLLVMVFITATGKRLIRRQNEEIFFCTFSFYLLIHQISLMLIGFYNCPLDFLNTQLYNKRIYPPTSVPTGILPSGAF